MKLETPQKYVHEATVTFNGRFPIDMLRYDRCYPKTETDSHVIQDSLSGEHNIKDQIVHIVKLDWRKNPLECFTFGRWQSFCCQIEVITE